MPLVSRTSNQGNLYKQAAEPGSWVDGDLWSDTTNNNVKVNVSGTATEIGATTFTNAQSIVASHSTTIGDYSQPINTLSVNGSIGTVGTDPTDWNEPFTVNNWAEADSDNIFVDTTNNYLSCDMKVDNTNDSAVFDLFQTTFDGDFEIRFKWHVTVMSGTVPRFYVLMSSADETANSATTQNCCGALITAQTTDRIAVSAGNSVNPESAATDEQSVTWSDATDYWIKLKKAGTTCTASYYTASDYSTGEVTSSTTATVTGLRYFAVRNLKTGNTGTCTGWIDDIELWVTGCGLARDDSTSTNWSSGSATNPAIEIEAGIVSTAWTSGLAIYLDATTTETEITIQIGTTRSYTTKRTITVSNLTAGAWNYIRWNAVRGRWIRIYGNSGTSKILAIDEIKYLSLADDAALLDDFGLLEISTTDTSLGLDGT